ncbi:hypothetical protein AAC387_Pa05g1184 [Persea americana]
MEVNEDHQQCDFSVSDQVLQLKIFNSMKQQLQNLLCFFIEMHEDPSGAYANEDYRVFVQIIGVKASTSYFCHTDLCYSHLYNEILGKGASKIAYRAFDEYEGIEHVSKHLVKDIIEYIKSFNHPNSVPNGRVEARAFIDKKGLQVVSSELHPGINGESIKRMMGSSNEVLVKEKMTGHLGGMPCTVYLIMKMNSGNQRSHNKGNVTGGESHPILRGKVGGYVLSEFVQKDKLYIIDGNSLLPRKLHLEIALGDNYQKEDKCTLHF